MGLEPRPLPKVDSIGYCPTCFERQGPLHSYGLLYHYCITPTHAYRWTTPAQWRQTDPAALEAVRKICQKTTLILYARMQQPQGLTPAAGQVDGTTEKEQP